MIEVIKTKIMLNQQANYIEFDLHLVKVIHPSFPKEAPRNLQKFHPN